MIKKMKRRVIIAAMLAFTAVIMMIAVLVNAVNYGVVTSRADMTLNALLTYEDQAPDKPGGDNPPMGPFRGLPDVESNYMTRFFIVRYDKEGNAGSVFMDYIASIDEEAALQYAQDAMKRRSDHGYIREYRYARENDGDGSVVVFLNTLREQQSIRSLLILTLIVSFVSLAIVFVLVVLLSGRAIRPIANNIQQQKQFITDASHELKTPVTSISTSVDVIEMEHGEDEWTDNIKKQTKRMKKLVNELVALSRLDEENPIPDKEDFSLSTAAWEMAKIFESRAKGHNKDLKVDIEDDITMHGDQDSIRQMMSVLLDNAIRYSDDGAEIRFSVSRKKGKINIETFNTCDYDKPPDVDRLFDRFYRPDASRNDKTGGTGIGLAIAKAVVNAHQGKISASCPSGKTMTIRIVF